MTAISAACRISLGIVMAVANHESCLLENLSCIENNIEATHTTNNSVTA